MKSDEIKFIESCIEWYKELVKWCEYDLVLSKSQLDRYKKRLAKTKRKPKTRAKPSVR